MTSPVKSHPEENASNAPPPPPHSDTSLQQQQPGDDNISLAATPQQQSNNSSPSSVATLLQPKDDDNIALFATPQQQKSIDSLPLNSAQSVTSTPLTPQSTPSNTSAMLLNMLNQSQLNLNQSQLNLKKAHDEVHYYRTQLEKANAEMMEYRTQLAKANAQLDQSQTRHLKADAQINQSQQNLKKAHDDVHHYRTQLDHDRTQLEKANAEMMEYRTQLAKANTQLDQSQTQLAKANAEINEYQTQLAKTNAESEELRSTMQCMGTKMSYVLKEDKSNVMQMLDEVLARAEAKHANDGNPADLSAKIQEPEDVLNAIRNDTNLSRPVRRMLEREFRQLFEDEKQDKTKKPRGLIGGRGPVDRVLHIRDKVPSLMRKRFERVHAQMVAFPHENFDPLIDDILADTAYHRGGLRCGFNMWRWFLFWCRFHRPSTGTVSTETQPSSSSSSGTTTETPLTGFNNKFPTVRELGRFLYFTRISLGYKHTTVLSYSAAFLRVMKSILQISDQDMKPYRARRLETISKLLYVVGTDREPSIALPLDISLPLSSSLSGESKLIFLLMALTGVRNNEAGKLTTDNIRITDSGVVIKVNEDVAKRTTRTLELNYWRDELKDFDLARMLVEWIREHDLMMDAPAGGGASTDCAETGGPTPNSDTAGGASTNCTEAGGSIPNSDTAGNAPTDCAETGGSTPSNDTAANASTNCTEAGGSIPNSDTAGASTPNNDTAANASTNCTEAGGSTPNSDTAGGASTNCTEAGGSIPNSDTAGASTPNNDTAANASTNCTEAGGPTPNNDTTSNLSSVLYSLIHPPAPLPRPLRSKSPLFSETAVSTFYKDTRPLFLSLNKEYNTDQPITPYSLRRGHIHLIHSSDSDLSFYYRCISVGHAPNANSIQHYDDSLREKRISMSHALFGAPNRSSDDDAPSKSVPFDPAICANPKDLLEKVHAHCLTAYLNTDSGRIFHSREKETVRESIMKASTFVDRFVQRVGNEQETQAITQENATTQADYDFASVNFEFVPGTEDSEPHFQWENQEIPDGVRRLMIKEYDLKFSGISNDTSKQDSDENQQDSGDSDDDSDEDQQNAGGSDDDSGENQQNPRRQRPHFKVEYFIRRFFVADIAYQQYLSHLKKQYPMIKDAHHWNRFEQHLQKSIFMRRFRKGVCSVHIDLEQEGSLFHEKYFHPLDRVHLPDNVLKFMRDQLEEKKYLVAETTWQRKFVKLFLDANLSSMGSYPLPEKIHEFVEKKGVSNPKSELVLTKYRRVVFVRHWLKSGRPTTKDELVAAGFELNVEIFDILNPDHMEVVQLKRYRSISHPLNKEYRLTKPVSRFLNNLLTDPDNRPDRGAAAALAEWYKELKHPVFRMPPSASMRKENWCALGSLEFKRIWKDQNLTEDKDTLKKMMDEHEEACSKPNTMAARSYVDSVKHLENMFMYRTKSRGVYYMPKHKQYNPCMHRLVVGTRWEHVEKGKYMEYLEDGTMLCRRRVKDDSHLMDVLDGTTSDAMEEEQQGTTSDAMEDQGTTTTTTQQQQDTTSDTMEQQQGTTSDAMEEEQQGTTSDAMEDQGTTTTTTQQQQDTTSDTMEQQQDTTTTTTMEDTIVPPPPGFEQKVLTRFSDIVEFLECENIGACHPLSLSVIPLGMRRKMAAVRTSNQSVITIPLDTPILSYAGSKKNALKNKAATTGTKRTREQQDQMEVEETARVKKRRTNPKVAQHSPIIVSDSDSDSDISMHDPDEQWKPQ